MSTERDCLLIQAIQPVDFADIAKFCRFLEKIFICFLNGTACQDGNRNG
jgi:hypothetical protein